MNRHGWWRGSNMWPWLFLSFVYGVQACNVTGNLFDDTLIAAPHDTTILFGTTFDLYCIINRSINHNLSKGVNSTDVNIQFANDNIPYQYDRENVNDSVVIFHVKNIEPGSHSLYCNLAAPSLCRLMSVTVNVGHLPAKVGSLNCTLPYWENLTCEWVEPHNDIETKYNATVQCPFGRNPGQAFPCHISQKNESSYCYVDSWSEIRPKCYLKIKGYNRLGSNVNSYEIDQIKQTIPPPPELLRHIAPKKTTNSFSITFNVTEKFMLFISDFSIDVEYCSELNKTWTSENTSSFVITAKGLSPSKIRTFTYELKNLPYAGTQYDVRIYLKAPGGLYRSASANGIFSTLPTRPSSPPLTTPGIFSFQQRNKLTIYWRKLDDDQKNSPTISYEVSCFSEATSGCPTSPKNTSETFAEFNNLEHAEYTFRIYSVNDIGFSMNYSEVHVPRFQTVRPVSPVVNDLNNGVYSVSWNMEHTVNQYHTIFYCEKDHTNNNCQGPLHWELVEGNNKTIYTHKKTKHMFGVSAQNSANTSSGISWATCILSNNTGDMKVANFIAPHKNSRFAVLEWKLGCLAVNQLNGYLITYCKAYHNGSAGKNSTTCTEAQKTVRITDPTQKKHNLTNLLPYSTYKVDIAIVLEGEGRGLEESIDVYTSEDVPDPPRNLKVAYVDHNSAVLEWQLPEYANGVLDSYILTSFFRNNVNTIKLTTRTGNLTSYNVTGLMSSTQYNFSLKVCNTVNCSTSTETSANTSMFHPDQISGLKVTVNQTSAKLTWVAPQGLEISNCFYDIKLEKKSTQEIYKFECSKLDAEININEFCLDGGQIYYSIRAVNVYNSSFDYVGNFSEPHKLPCVVVSQTLFYILVVLAFFIIVLILLAASISYLMKKQYIKCQPFKPTVEISMPGGMATTVSHDKWPPGRGIDETIFTTRRATLPNEKTPLQDVKDNEEEEMEGLENADAGISWRDTVIEPENGCADDTSPVESSDYAGQLACVPEENGGEYTFVAEMVKGKPKTGYVMCGHDGVITTMSYVSLPSTSTIMPPPTPIVTSSKPESSYVTSLPPLKPPSSPSNISTNGIAAAQCSTAPSNPCEEESPKNMMDNNGCEDYELDEDDIATLENELVGMVPQPQTNGYVPNTSIILTGK